MFCQCNKFNKLYKALIKIKMDRHVGQQKMSDFLKSQDLFNKSYTNTNFKRSVMYFGRQSEPPRYAYHVPSDLLKFQTSEKTQKHQGQDFSPIKAEMEDKSISNPQQSLRSSRIKTLGVHNSSWVQTLNQTKKKYFEVCRNEAQQFSNKIIGIINEDLQVLQVKIEEVRLTIKQHIFDQKQEIKCKLYQMIDRALQKWVKEQQTNYKNKEYEYLGDLIELQAIMQERVKSINALKSNLQTDSEWRQVAGNLLSGYYQQDATQLSEQCKHYVSAVSEQVNKMLKTRTDILKFELLQYHNSHQYFFKQVLFNQLKSITQTQANFKHAHKKNQKNNTNDSSQQLMKKALSQTHD